MEFELNFYDRDLFDYIVGIGPLIAALIAVGIAWWQGRIQNDQRKLMLSEKKLNIKYKFENYVNKLIYDCSKKTLNTKPLENSYNELMCIAEDAFLLFDEKIYNAIMELAKIFQELHTSLDYNIRKRTGKDISFFKENEGKFNKEYDKLIAQIEYRKTTIIGEMFCVIREDKI